MSSDLIKRAKRLDSLRSKRISEKLTLYEAESIVQVWGKYLEYSGGLRYLFNVNTPESFLPYPIVTLQGAINKMQAYYYERGMQDKVKLLEETESSLMEYTNDEEALKKAADLFLNDKWQKAFIPGLQSIQKDRIQAGFIVRNELFTLSKSRIEELT